MSYLRKNLPLITIQRTHVNCSICGDQLFGRLDKKFCSLECKNEYHRKRRAQHLPFSKSVDQMLHGNWVVLRELADEIGKRKFFVSKARLNKSGFHTKYYTTSQKNKEGKIYYYIYNFGWMDFSDKEMMVVQMRKSK